MGSGPSTPEHTGKYRGVETRFFVKIIKAFRPPFSFCVPVLHLFSCFNHLSVLSATYFSEKLLSNILERRGQ